MGRHAKNPKITTTSIAGADLRSRAQILRVWRTKVTTVVLKGVGLAVKEEETRNRL